MDIGCRDMAAQEVRAMATEEKNAEIAVYAQHKIKKKKRLGFGPDSAQLVRTLAPREAVDPHDEIWLNTNSGLIHLFQLSLGSNPQCNE